MSTQDERWISDRVFVPIARGLVRLGCTANGLTIGGMLLILAGLVVMLVTGRLLVGGLIAGFGAVLDALDGRVARLRGTSGHAGSFIDSVCDRVSDSAIFAVAAWIWRADPLLFGVLMVGMGMAQLTSYVRAKAESLGWEASQGPVERPIRVLLILCGMGFGFLPLSAWLLAVGGTVTVARRVAAVQRQARAGVTATPDAR